MEKAKYYYQQLTGDRKFTWRKSDQTRKSKTVFEKRKAFISIK
jgi:hypothetical protein